jgi:oxygen-dependent protoporphyrinogen oxidase
MRTTRSRRDVIVVGGGISGLVTAWRLKRSGAAVTLLESDATVGGCIQTEHRDGLLLEKGPFNVLVRDESFHELLEACRDDVALVRASEAAKQRFIFRRGALHAVPTSPPRLVRTPLLSAGGKLRLLRGLLWSRPAAGEDATISEAASRRLGVEVADTFVSSIVAGVFGGDSRRLSLSACFPTIGTFDAEARSPLFGGVAMMRKRRKAARAEGRAPRPRLGLISFERGLGGITDWLGRQLGSDLVTGCRVESIVPIDDGDGGYAVRCRDAAQEHAGRALVLATAKQPAAELLRPLAAPAAELLDTIDSASLVVLNLAFPRERIEHPMQGYGYLVPQNEPDVPVMGVLWADSAFPHHAPETHRLLRVFMGGPRDPNAVDRDDDELLRTARAALDGLLGIDGEPTFVDVCRWPRAIPQYHVGHRRRLERLAEAIDHLPRLHLVGNYLTGVSVNDCVRDATRAADAVLAGLAGVGGGGTGDAGSATGGAAGAGAVPDHAAQVSAR